jgi:thiamine-monophosphate kinase
MGERRVADLGEDALVAGLLGLYPAAPPWLRVGPGDDAAVLDLPGTAGLVVSTDTLVEGRDFRRDWSSGAEVGVKVAAQSMADIAAMGARPRALLVSLAAPGDLPADFAADLARGLAEECARAGAAVVGGDVSDADQVVLTGTAIGLLDPGVDAVRRGGARPGDTVALAGRTGASAAGLALLQAGRTVGVAPALADLLAAHRAPRPPYLAGPAAARARAHAMIDTSDGLLRDAARIAMSSAVVLDLDPQALPAVPGLAEAADLLGAPDLVRQWQLTGGEDHALLACFAPQTALPEAFVPIGTVLAAVPSGGARRGGGQVLVAGQDWAGSPGWTHW